MKILETRLTLEDFILKLQKVPSLEVEQAQLQDWVARLDLEDLAISKHICFSPENYQRQILYRDSNCEIILVCWQPGQFSPIHDHGDSLNVTHVYKGVLTSRTFARTDSTTKKLSPLLLEEKYLGFMNLLENICPTSDLRLRFSHSEEIAINTLYSISLNVKNLLSILITTSTKFVFQP
ncbi:MAG: hypothetical protein ACRC2S_25735 [Waterburya sp.]